MFENNNKRFSASFILYSVFWKFGIALYTSSLADSTFFELQNYCFSLKILQTPIVSCTYSNGFKMSFEEEMAQSLANLVIAEEEDFGHRDIVGALGGKKFYKIIQIIFLNAQNV